MTSTCCATVFACLGRCHACRSHGNLESINLQRGTTPQHMYSQCQKYIQHVPRHCWPVTLSCLLVAHKPTAFSRLPHAYLLYCLQVLNLLGNGP
jgi:hypothetical protein